MWVSSCTTTWLSDCLLQKSSTSVGLIWQRPYDTRSSITEEGKWSVAFNGSSLSSKAYWRFRAWQWESSERGWKDSLPDSSNMPDWAQGGKCSSRVQTLICAYWLWGTGICPGVITPCLDSSCLKLKLAHPLLGCLLHLNRQVKAFIMVKLLETHEMQPRWEVWGSHYFSTWTKGRSLLSSQTG